MTLSLVSLNIIKSLTVNQNCKCAISLRRAIRSLLATNVVVLVRRCTPLIIYFRVKMQFVAKRQAGTNANLAGEVRLVFFR